MKLKPTMKKHIIAGAICFLVIAAIVAGLILAAGNNGQDAVVETGGEQGSAGVTAGVEDNPADAAAGGEQGSTGQAGAAGDGQTPADSAAEENLPDVILNIYSTDRELHQIIDIYAKKHWDFEYKLNVYNDVYVFGATEVADLAGKALASGGSEVDIYCLPAAYAPKFIKGEYSNFACTYKELGMDVDAALEKADIPGCIIEDGSNPNGELIALPYLGETSVFMYRRSVAKEVWGTEDPDRMAAIIGAGTQKWDKFIEAAQTLSEHGYYIVSGFDSLEYMIDTTPAYKTGPTESFEADPGWVKFMDVSKYMLDNGFIKHTKKWWNEWWDDIDGKNDKVFGFVSSTDTNQFMGIHETAGDWAACIPPFNTRAPFNTGILVSKNSPNRDLLGPLIEWITLDSSEDGFQYSLANGTSAIPHSRYENEKCSVSSGTVMQKVDGSLSILGGQNINPLVYDALEGSKGLYQTNVFEYDIFQGWLDVIQVYIDGEKDRDTAIADYLSQVRETGEVKRQRQDPSLEELVVWKDENFKAAVREQLQIPILMDIDKGYLLNVTELNLAGRDIKSLEDIVHFKDLAKLDCSNNQIADISYLKELKKLRKLDMSGNMISDISGLSDLTYLKELYLHNNKISDISRLKELTKLENLNLSGNEIVDWSPVDHVDNVIWK